MLTAYQVKIEMANKRLLTTIIAKDGDEAIGKAMKKGEEAFSNHYVLELIEKHMKVTLTELSDNPIMEGIRELEKELEGWRNGTIIYKKGGKNEQED